MGKEGGFLEYHRKDPGYRPVNERLQDFKAVELALSDKEIIVQAARCMDCGIPFCHGYGCPLHNIIPEFNDHVYHQRWREALRILLSTNPFPEFTGRICPAPCEAACVLGINDDPVTIRTLELAIIEKAFAEGFMTASRSRQTGLPIAIVGSGPAGLAAAHVLNSLGHRVTVFESDPEPGGILRYGIPNFKLEKWVVRRRINLMQSDGIKFETSVTIGDDISYRYLKNHFRAIILAGGARQPRDLNVPGRKLKGIHFAMDFLKSQNMQITPNAHENRPTLTAKGMIVVVIGGGDTGSDCLGTALRQGARKIYQLEIMPEPPAERSPSTPWPEWPLKRRDSSSHKEGGERRWSVMTEAFLGDENGNLRGLRCCQVEWTHDKKSGRPVPKRVAGSEFEVTAGLALLAMGFVGPGRSRLVDELGLKLNPHGFIERNADHMTTEPGLFVCGDMTAGASLVVRAIEDGKQTAHGVHTWLNK